MKYMLFLAYGKSAVTDSKSINIVSMCTLVYNFDL